MESLGERAPFSEGPWASRGGSAPGLLPLIRRGRWFPLRSKHDRVAYLVKTPRGDFFVKHYKPSTLWGRLRDMVTRRKPFRAFKLGRFLSDKGVGTPEPLALLTRGFPVPGEALLVSEWLGDTLHWKEHLFDPETAKDREAFRLTLADMAALLGKMHKLGYYHGDLSGNIVVGKSEKGFKPYVIDLEELSRSLSDRRRVKNLEELGRGQLDLKELSLRERWYFLTVYANTAGMTLEEARKIWRMGKSQQLKRIEKANNRRQGG